MKTMSDFGLVDGRTVASTCHCYLILIAVFAHLPSPQLQLRDQTERLGNKVGYLEGRLGHLVSSSTDLSCRLVQSEEEKLKVDLMSFVV